MSFDYFRSLIRQAWSSLRARPGLTATVTLSLAIGLGANAMLFAVVDGAILRPFPFPEPDRLVGVGAGFPRINRPLGFFEALSGPEYVDIRTVSSLVNVAAFDLGNEPVLIGDTPERVFTAFVWDDPLKTLHLAPSLGRSFTVEELRTAEPVAVVSRAFWQTQLGGDADAVGRTIHVAGRPHIVIGVMPERTRLWYSDLWLPMSEAASSIARNRRQFNVLARLAPGVTVQAANADLARLASTITSIHGAAFPEYDGFAIAARPWTEIEVWGFSGVTVIVFAAVGLLLLLVATNLASLLAAKSVARRGEMAVRTALGAGRRTLMAQLGAETLLQTAAGAVLGLLLAWLGTQVLPSVLALGLAALGIYGVLSHAVNARTHEIGLRFALGADGRSVLRLMLGQALRPVLSGLVVGVGLVLGGQRFLAGWLYGTTPEVAPLALVSTVVLLVSIAASAWPIMRTTKLSPMMALTRR